LQEKEMKGIFLFVILVFYPVIATCQTSSAVINLYHSDFLLKELLVKNNGKRYFKEETYLYSFSKKTGEEEESSLRLSFVGGVERTYCEDVGFYIADADYDTWQWKKTNKPLEKIEAIGGDYVILLLIKR
jgi:hypothetical protein